MQQILHAITQCYFMQMHDVSTYYRSQVSLLASIDSLVQRRNYRVGPTEIKLYLFMTMTIHIPFHHTRPVSSADDL